jgi:hypothetical protein
VVLLDRIDPERRVRMPLGRAPQLDLMPREIHELSRDRSSLGRSLVAFGTRCDGRDRRISGDRRSSTIRR